MGEIRATGECRGVIAANGRAPCRPKPMGGNRHVLIKSPAGEFPIEIAKFETEDGYLVMVGKMGVWDARTYITARELLGVIAKLLTPVVLMYLVRLPFLLFRGAPETTGAPDGGG